MSNLLVKVVARAATPTQSGVTATVVAHDLAVYGGPVIALVSSLAAEGAISVPGTWLGVVNAVIALLTSLASIQNQKATAAKVAAVKVASAVKAARKAGK